MIPDTLTVHPQRGPIRGTVRVPGDKSITHRALILAAIAERDTRILRWLDAADTRSTRAALGRLGVAISDAGEDLIVHGVGRDGLRAADGPIDCGNSGTSMRLLAGLLAGQPFASELVGDGSLMRRPMERVAEPLRSMGAEVMLSAGGTAPIRIRGRRPLRGGGRFRTGSAQVDAAIRLAALFAEAAVSIEPTRAYRCHTEIMLPRFAGSAVASFEVPGDVSSAAPLLVLQAVHPDARIELPGLVPEPSRDAVLSILADMGRPLRATRIDGDRAAIAMDEIPVLAVAAACAEGESLVADAAELRVKESDRITTTVAALRALGVAADEREDGMRITGSRLRGGVVDAAGDHRVAMAFLIAGTVAEGPVTVRGCANIATSYPGFVDDLRALGVEVEEQAA